MKRSTIYIFDLGGVLIKLNVSRCMRAFEALMGEENMRLILGMDRNGEGVKAVSVATKQLMADFERGQISPETFLGEVLHYCHPGTTEEQVVDAWMSMLGELPQERLDFIDRLRAQGHPVYLLSNGNDLHFDFINRTYGLEGHFDGLFLSQKMHLSKPEPAIFEAVNERVRELTSEVEVLFIDDIEVNRLAAERTVGWKTYSSITELTSSHDAIVQYIEQVILPQYDAFDGGHKRDHAQMVIEESLKLAREHGADEQMAYVIAAYHDLGLRSDRETHHIHSGEILMADEKLRKWFTEEQIQTMRDAVEDHRASSKNPPRTIYGAIVAEADRQINPTLVIHRTMAYSAKLYPDGDFETLYQRSKEHLLEKYAEGGYMQLWLNSERNVRSLEELRAIIRNEQQLRALCQEWYDKMMKKTTC